MRDGERYERRSDMRDGAMAYAYSERGDLRAYVRVRGRAGVHTSGRVESIGRARPQKKN